MLWLRRYRVVECQHILERLLQCIVRAIPYHDDACTLRILKCQRRESSDAVKLRLAEVCTKGIAPLTLPPVAYKPIKVETIEIPRQP